jgi:hypothetical protein
MEASGKQEGSHAQTSDPLQPPKFHFERLPLAARLRVYDGLTPEAFIFQGGRRGTPSRWPKNPVAALAICFDQLKKEINFRLYSTSRFIFYDGLNLRHRIYGYEIAAQFFTSIGPLNLSHVKQIYCHFHWTDYCIQSPEFFSMLSTIARGDPPRNIRDLRLSFTKTSHVRPYEGARTIRRPCFVLHGFLGVKITFIFSSTWDIVSAARLNAWIEGFHKPGPAVNFLTVLPAEIRAEVFRHLVPHVYNSIQTPDPRVTKTAGWMTVNRQMKEEICSVLYHDSQLEFHFTSILPGNQGSDENDRIRRFLRRIGRHNARQIRTVKICLQIYPRLRLAQRMYTPSIKAALDTLRAKCNMGIGGCTVPHSLVADGESGLGTSTRQYQFRIPTRPGTSLVVDIQMIWLSNSGPLLSTQEQDYWAALSLSRSLSGVPSYVS